MLDCILTSRKRVFSWQTQPVFDAITNSKQPKKLYALCYVSFLSALSSPMHSRINDIPMRNGNESKCNAERFPSLQSIQLNSARWYAKHIAHSLCIIKKTNTLPHAKPKPVSNGSSPNLPNNSISHPPIIAYGNSFVTVIKAARVIEQTNQGPRRDHRLRCPFWLNRAPCTSWTRGQVDITIKMTSFSRCYR